MARILAEHKAKQFLKNYNIPITREYLAKNPGEAVTFSKRLKYPVVMKISSPDILHKTEAKGVATGISCDEEVEKTYNRLVKSAKRYKQNARINGVLIQETLSGTEVIIGSSKDPQFGQTIMFGIGGILVEVLKDVSFRIIPIKKDDALEMIGEIKGNAVLKGVRGKKPADINSIVKTLLKVSKLLQANPNISELDINPLFASAIGVKAADARIVFD